MSRDFFLFAGKFFFAGNIVYISKKFFLRRTQANNPCLTRRGVLFMIHLARQSDNVSKPRTLANFDRKTNSVIYGGKI